MKQMTSTCKLLAAVTIGTCLWMASPCPAEGRETGSEVLTPQRIDPRIEFIQAFYKGLDENGYDQEYVKQYVTGQAAQYLKDSYSYDCGEENDCMAGWLFAYDMTDPGALEELAINESGVQDIDGVSVRTYTVMHFYSGSFYGDYTYTIRLGIIQTDEGSYKIATFEHVSSQTERPIE